jgi:hypothetical protein
MRIFVRISYGENFHKDYYINTIYDQYHLEKNKACKHDSPGLEIK